MGLLAGCAGHSSINPAESLDERTGMTVGSLHKPIELVQRRRVQHRRPASAQSFAYLGPVEWDNMGNLRYGLWIHLAPGNDWRFDDIRSPQAVTLTLDDGAVVLSAIDAPTLGSWPLPAGGLVGPDGVFRPQRTDAPAHGVERED